MDTTTTEARKSSKNKEAKQLDKIDKVYSEMKQKNKKLKADLRDQKSTNETLRTIFAEFRVEFRQNKKQDKEFHQLTVADLQDIFAIQEKLMAQIQSMGIGTDDLQNGNWAEFDNMEQ